MPYFHGLGHWSARSSQLIASPHVLKFAKSVALLFAQQVRQGLREPGWYGFAPVQVPGYTPVRCDVGAERLFSAHGNDLPSPQPPTVSPSLRTVAGTTTSLPLPTMAGPVIWGATSKASESHSPFLVSKSRGRPSWPMYPVRRFPR